MGAKFLRLLDETIPKDSPLYPCLNRNTVKLSYRCLPNMGTNISKQNSKNLTNATTPNEETTPSCNCNRKDDCPLEGQCLKKNVVYQATLTQGDGKIENYIGLTAQTFKKRWDGHTNSFRHEKYSKETALSIHIWKLKRQNIGWNLKWKVISRASPFSPISGKCNL